MKQSFIREYLHYFRCCICWFKVGDLESKLSKLVQDNQCHIQNAEAVKKGLEAKLKDQEKELKAEAADCQAQVNGLSKELDEVRKLLTQEKTAALQQQNQLKTQVEKAEIDKR